MDSSEDWNHPLADRWRKEKGAGLVVLCFLSWTNSRAGARAERRLRPQTTCRRFNPTCIAHGTAAPQATTHCIQLLLALQYQAASWHQPRRVVGKVEWHQGELFPCVGFIATNFSKRAKNARIKCLREDVPVVPGAA